MAQAAGPLILPSGLPQGATKAQAPAMNFRGDRFGSATHGIGMMCGDTDASAYDGHHDVPTVH